MSLGLRQSILVAKWARSSRVDAINLRLRELGQSAARSGVHFFFSLFPLSRFPLSLNFKKSIHVFFVLPVLVHASKQLLRKRLT